MSRFHMLSHRGAYLVFFVLLLLMLGPAQSSWCFQGGDATVVPESLSSDCHSDSAVCPPSADLLKEQDWGGSLPDCNECFDVSFEASAPACMQGRNAIIVFSPAITYLQPPSGELQGNIYSSSFISLSEQPLRKNLNVHRSIPSTVLII